MKHPHYDMIVAKAANMDLVVFAKGGDNWIALNGLPTWNEGREYFLCHPKHKEACLHWLNGGEILVNTGCKDGERYFFGILRYNNGATSDSNSFLKSNYDFRIKPRKEKRWIAYRKGFGDCAPRTFDSIESAKFWVNHNSEASEDYWAFIEIEVEV